MSQRGTQASHFFFGSLFVLLTVFLFYSPEFRYYSTQELPKDFSHVRGYAYKATVPDSIVNVTAWNSRRVLLEDGRALAPEGSSTSSIGNDGRGAHLHLNAEVIFSTSDNSDPLKNGKSYAIQYPKKLPTALLLALGVVYMLLLAFVGHKISHLFNRTRFRTLAGIAVGCAVTLVSVELVSKILLHSYLFDEGKKFESLYERIFNEFNEDMELHTFQYMPHHYMNYALNPATPLNKRIQYNPLFLIRRQEPVRPRELVKWRALVVGGSTTFDVQVPDEENTWVYRLEKLIRDRFGKEYDVINGGVGGYTIYENFIHYITLLTYLEPDVVIFFSGINDVHPRFFGHMENDYRNYCKPASELSELFTNQNRSVLRFSNLYRLLQMRFVYRPVMSGIGKFTRKPYPSPATWDDSLRKNSNDLYEKVLRNFVTLLLAQKRRVVIIPQYFQVLGESDLVFRKGVRDNNASNKRLAVEFGLPYLAELEEGHVFSPDDLNDNCHFNEWGTDRMAQVTFQFIVEQQLALQAPEPIDKDHFALTKPFLGMVENAVKNRQPSESQESDRGLIQIHSR